MSGRTESGSGVRITDYICFCSLLRKLSIFYSDAVTRGCYLSMRSTPEAPTSFLWCNLLVELREDGHCSFTTIVSLPFKTTRRFLLIADAPLGSSIAVYTIMCRVAVSFHVAPTSGTLKTRLSSIISAPSSPSSMRSLLAPSSKLSTTDKSYTTKQTCAAIWLLTCTFVLRFLEIISRCFKAHEFKDLTIVVQIFRFRYFRTSRLISLPEAGLARKSSAYDFLVARRDIAIGISLCLQKHTTNALRIHYLRLILRVKMKLPAMISN